MNAKCLLVWFGNLALFSMCGAQAAERPKPELVEVRKIWDAAPHNAFTDLVRFKNEWFCVFREGQAHVSPDGALRVITSKDGRQWSSAALLTSTNSDLRDAKITVTPEGQLMLSGAGQTRIAGVVLRRWPALDRAGENRGPESLALAHDLAQRRGLQHRLRHDRREIHPPVPKPRWQEVRNACSHAFRPGISK
jgi:hypothetical protein